MKIFLLYILFAITLISLYGRVAQAQELGTRLGHCESEHIDANLIPNRSNQWRNADDTSETYCRNNYGQNAQWTPNGNVSGPNGPQPDPNPTPLPSEQKKDPTASYTLLAPLPEIPAEFDTEDPEAFNNYLNIAIKIFIGICAVLAVVMIVIGGIEYSTSELISSKEAAKERIREAILGLLLALSAWVILYQINPELVDNDIKINKQVVTVNIKEFILSSAQSRNGRVSAPVDLRTVGCPAATAAAQASGMDRALLLAIFQQETSQGKDIDGCRANSAAAHMTPANLAALGRIVGVNNIGNTYVSCSARRSDGTFEGSGGAMGPMQFTPVTWEQYGRGGDPWNLNDAMMAAGRKLSAEGGRPWNQDRAVGRYFGACSNSTTNYCASVESHKINFQRQIAAGVCGK